MTPLERVCRLPIDFRKGDRSAHRLVHDAGMDPALLSTAAIAMVLRSDPALVDAWLQWSEDQRSDHAHWFSRKAEGYVVGLAPGDEGRFFTDPVAACSEFIVKQVRAIW